SFGRGGHGALVRAASRGRGVGVGAEVGVVEDRLQITRVHDKGPASDAGLRPGDRMVRIAGQPVEDLPAEAAAERLRGEPGSVVEVEVADGVGNRTVKLVRRAVYVPSVGWEMIRLDDGSPGGIAAGVLRIHHFQDSTPHEVKEALGQMYGRMEPVKGLILDLRGNPGGLFRSAVAVAELFSGGGVIVVGQSPFKEYNKVFKADTPGPFQLPMGVLIDGEQASAPEGLAGG